MLGPSKGRELPSSRTILFFFLHARFLRLSVPTILEPAMIPTDLLRELSEADQAKYQVFLRGGRRIREPYVASNKPDTGAS